MRIRFLHIVFLLLAIVVFVILLFGHKDIPLSELQEKYELPSSDYLDIQGMQVHYSDEGNPMDTLPLVLIHGTGSSLHTFEAWSKVLKEEKRVIRMDLPAYGLTGPFPDRDYRMENYVAFISEFLEALHINKCILGGNSLGGGISWRVALSHPDLVQKLILIDASGYPTLSESRPIAFRLAEVPIIKQMFTYITPRSIARASVENVYADKSKVSEQLVDRYFELTLREGNRQAFVDRINTQSKDTLHKSISRITQNTLILWGDQDELIPVENAYKFQNDLLNNTLVIFENIGHVPMEESPALSLTPVIDFINN